MRKMNWKKNEEMKKNELKKSLFILGDNIVKISKFGQSQSTYFSWNPAELEFTFNPEQTISENEWFKSTSNSNGSKMSCQKGKSDCKVNHRLSIVNKVKGENCSRLTDISTKWQFETSAVNNWLSNMCNGHSTSFIDHSVNIEADNHLNKSKLNLTNYGK